MQNSIPIGIGATIFPENFNEIEDIYNFSIQEKVDFLRIVPGLKVGLSENIDIDYSNHIKVIEKMQSIISDKLIDFASEEHEL
ncbi:hypothetical protein PRVXT_000599 [Proteinivorax tanatarense]|uniref:Uncharacterized protein n=1 Tax=Proteinivorax tanatarense TaxID=1260629 RepID=A0AAU7VN33_9FIRM